MPPFDPTKIRLYFPELVAHKKIPGGTFRINLEGLPILGSDALEHLLENPQLITNGWKGKWVSFWGDVYRDEDGILCVRTLRWNGATWTHDVFMLSGQWSASHPAALDAR